MEQQDQGVTQGLEKLLGRKVTVAPNEAKSKPVEAPSPKAAPAPKTKTPQAKPPQEGQNQDVTQGLEKLLGRQVTRVDSKAPAPAAPQYNNEYFDYARLAKQMVMNPLAMTDEEWQGKQQDIRTYIESKAGKGFLGGAAIGVANTALEFTSPFQVALLVGTFGESALARTAAKVGGQAAIPVARTMAKLMQGYFAWNMAQGVVVGTKESINAATSGDWETASEMGVGALISGVMLAGMGSHELAEHKVRGDLEKVAREKYGQPEGKIGQTFKSVFDSLDPFKQAEVIDETVKRTPEYQAMMKTVEDQDEAAKTHSKKTHEKRVAAYYGRAMGQAWNPDAVKRSIKIIDEHRQAQEAKDVEESHRTHYLKQIANLIDLHRQDKADKAETAAMEEERRAAAREGRTPRKSAAAQKREDSRKVTLTNAAQITEARRGVGEHRDAFDRESSEQDRVAAEKATEQRGVVRHPAVVQDPEGNVTYRARTMEGDHHYGVTWNEEGEMQVYRKTPGGIEYLGANGLFEEKPGRVFVAPDTQTADALAQITSLRVEAAYALEEHGSTPEREAEHSQLRNLERQLVDGEITGEQARKSAGLPEEATEEEAKKTVNHEIEAARSGVLNGPLQGKTRAQAEEEFIAQMIELEEAGDIPGAMVNAYLDAFPVAIRDAAENNLHYVSRSGDWIASKKGTTWVLDSKGMLQPDDGLSAPIPLLKNGRYSTQALDLAMSGRVGFGQRSWEDAKVEDQREREANQQLDNLAQNVADELENAINLSRQNAGLKLEAGELPVEIPAPTKRSRFAPPVEGEMGVSPERETDRLVEEGYAASQAEAKALDEVWINAIGDYIGENHTSAWDLIQQIAKNSGLTPQEVVAIQMERMSPPNTLEGKIERLKAGDIITDKMGLPWVVKADKNGTLYLRKGQGARIHVNRFKPSDDVRRIVGTGEVQPAPGPRYTPEDIRKVAFEAPYLVRRQEVIEEVKERAENPPPPPRTQEQADKRVEEAEDLYRQVRDAAVNAAADAIDPNPKDTDKEINERVAKAEELRKVAEAAAKQASEARERAAKPGDYPQKASITSKRNPRRTWAVGHDGYIQTNTGKIPIHRELVKLSQLTPSFRWNGNQLERVPEYPTMMQDVPPDEATRAAVLADAQPVRYEVDQYLDPGYGPERGPAIVDIGGDVVGGNRRLLRMMKYLELIEGDEVALAQFRAHMADYAAKNGMIYPEGDEIYIPVRMLDESIGTAAKATELGDLFNKGASHKIDESAKSITHGRMLLESQKDEESAGRVGVLDRIANDFNTADTPREAIANNPVFYAEIAKKYFKITDAENADWFDKNSAGEFVLSVDGKEKFEKALLATALKNSATLDSLRGTTIYQSLLKAIGPLTRLRSIPDKDITGVIDEAIAATAATERKRIDGDTPKVRWNKVFAEQDMFSEEKPPPEPGRMVETVWRALHDRKTTRFKNALNDYLVGEGVQRYMFDPQEHGLKTPADLFNAAFEDELKDVRNFRGVNSPEAHGKKDGDAMREFLETLPWELTQDQFNAAMRNEPLSDEAVADAKRSEEGKPPVAPKETTVEGGSKKMFITKRDELDLKGLGYKPDQINKMTPEEAADILSLGKQAPKGFKPPEPPAPKPEADLAAAKAEKGYITPDELQRYLEYDFATKDHVAENMWTAQMLAERVYDADPPVGVDRKDALAWALKERVAGIGRESGAKGGAFMAESRLGRGYIVLFDNAHAGTFTHEFAHAIFPLLSAEDRRAINSIKVDTTAWKKIYGEKWNFPEWDGEEKSLKDGKTFDGVSEKLAYGLDKFRRDEKPTGFDGPVGAVLTKIWKMFRDAYQEIIKRTKSDPLSPFNLEDAPDARKFFMDTFHIEETDNFNAAEDWKNKVEVARREEKKLKSGVTPIERKLHPILQIASDLGPTPTHISRGSEWPIVESDGDRVAYEKTNNTVVFEYPDEENAAHAYVQATMEGSGISGVEELKGPDGKFAIRFNWGLPEKGSKEKPKDIPNSILYQEVPKRNEQLQIEKLEDLLKKTSAPFMQQFVRKQIEKLKSEIRAKYGVESPKIGFDPEVARKAIAEVRNAKGNIESGRPGVSNLRGVSDGASRDRQQAGIGRLTKPPVMGMPGHAGARGATDRTGPGRGNAQPVNLANVAAVKLNPLPERGAPVGIRAGDTFDEKAWREGNKRAGLPENMPAPTVTLSPEVARVLKYGGQKQIVQTILSALETGDGAVIASATGSGKSFHAGAVIKETLLKNPDAKILLITKNRGLLKTAAQIGRDNFDYEMEVETPEGALDKNVYGASYQRLLNNDIYAKTQWDLVIADESGEARNWHQEQNQQGKLLKAVMDNAKKGVYVSATPFHSPMEYGYLDKLNLWPKGGFEQWIKENFAHEKVGDKIIAKLDPAKQAKMRQQLIERGQMVSQEISYDGFTTHFGVVPVTDVVERKLDRIHQGIAVMKRELLKQGKKGLSERVSAFEATYTKAYLERSRLPEAIQLVKRARAAGWQVVVFSETTSEDLFRRPVSPKEEPGTYRMLDEETGGQIGRIMPEFPNIMDELRSEFGDEIGDYSGSGNTDAQREESKEAFLKGKKPILYTSYAAGGIGVSLHDEDGDKPRVSIFLGPPYSGVLLEQSLGRTWRFGVKSNARAIFLATDSEPDIRLMATKVGPRMRALRASVLGERDSLASVMSNYTDEEKMREHQDMLAYSEQGNEVKVDAQGFQVRSKRKVNFDNWSSITFPNAEEAKNKGMQVEMSGGGKGSDWATLYQEKPKRWEPPNRPLTIEDIRIRRAVNAAADKAAENPQIPHEEVTMTAVRAEEIAKEAPEGVDKEAAARDAVGAHLKGLGYVQDPLTGEWKTPEEIVPAEPATGPEEKYRAALGMISSQEQNIINLDRQMNTGGAGRELVTKTRRYTAKVQRELADRRTDFTKIMQDNHLNPKDDKTMRDIFDVVMGKRAVADPAINKAAGQVSAMMAKIHQLGAEGKLSVRTPDGRMIPWSDFQDDASYMPRIADWNAKFTDAEGKTYTLKEIMGGTFGEIRAKELLAKKLREEGSVLTADQAYSLIKREQLRAPVQGNIHRTNEQNFPFIRKDYGALDNYFKQFSKAMATESEFGSDLRKLQKEIAKIPNKQARADVESMFGYMFTPQNWDSDLGRVYNTVAAMETATKMTFSAAKVLFHAANAPMVMGGKMMPIVKAIVHLATDRKAVRENGYYIGTVMHGVDPAIMYMPETKTQHALFKYTGFEYLYNLGRTIAGESARVYLDQYAMHDLKKGGFQAETSRRLLKQTFLIGDHAIDEFVRTGKWTPEDYKLAQVAFTNESMYSENPMQMPGLSRQRIAGEGLSTNTKRLHMALRASYSLQSFSTKTYSMLREHLYDEVVLHHNYKPLAYAIIVAPVIGQMLQGASSGVKGGVHRLAQYGMGKTHTEDAWDKWLAQFTGLKDKPAAAFVKLYIDGICSQWAVERTKRMADALFNITIGDKASLKSAQAEGRYFLNDEIEQDIGPIWSDTVMRPIEFTGEEFEAAATSESQKLEGKPGSFLSRTGKNVVRNAEEMVPLLRQEPHVEEYLAPKKRSGKWQVP